MDISQTITVTIATIGAVLGILNSVVQLSKNRVILKVIPKRGTPVNKLNNTFIKNTVNISGERTINKEDYVCIEVINLSSFMVTVSEVGFNIKGSPRHSYGLRMAIAKPIIKDGKPYPRRLDSRESLSVYAKLTDFDPDGFCLIKSAYAKTDCGVVRKGTTPALKELVKITKKDVIRKTT